MRCRPPAGGEEVVGLIQLHKDADDPTDADVLIALYRLPNQDADRQSRTKQLIKDAIQEWEDTV